MLLNTGYLKFIFLKTNERILFRTGLFSILVSLIDETKLILVPKCHRKTLTNAGSNVKITAASTSFL